MKRTSFLSPASPAPSATTIAITTWTRRKRLAQEFPKKLREYVRYRRLGWESGKPAGAEASYNLWNNAHTATLEEYRIIGPNTNSQLYHPEAINLMGDF
jgi:hypothetical protein